MLPFDAPGVCLFAWRNGAHAVVGTSMGCAVIWSYVELFGTARLKSAVFVDQVRNTGQVLKACSG
jgi:hypothetical protein